jgi:hypothetical protein
MKRNARNTISSVSSRTGSMHGYLLYDLVGRKVGQNKSFYEERFFTSLKYAKGGYLSTFRILEDDMEVAR